MLWKSQVTIDSDNEEDISIDFLPLFMFFTLHKFAS